MRRTVSTSALLLAAATALVAGCGSSTIAAPPAPALASPPPSPIPSPAPTAARARLAVEQVATRYLAARENAISYRHPSPRSWLTEARPLMTFAGWQRLTRGAGARGNFPTAAARAHGWSVRVTVLCQHDPDAGPATGNAVTLTCAVTDHTISAAGVPVPTRWLPSVWPYDGPQPPALLAMRKVDGHWLVDLDQTGQAG